MITETKWQMIHHFSGEKEHGLKYQSNYKGYDIFLEIITPVKKGGGFGKEKRYFYAEEYKEIFKTPQELIEFIDNKILEMQKEP